MLIYWRVNPNWMVERERKTDLLYTVFARVATIDNDHCKSGFQRYYGAWYISVIFQTKKTSGEDKTLKDSSFGRVFLSHSWADLSNLAPSMSYGTVNPIPSTVQTKISGGWLVLIIWSKQVIYVLKMMRYDKQITFIFLGWWPKLLSGTPTWQCIETWRTYTNLTQHHWIYVVYALVDICPPKMGLVSAILKSLILP